MTNANDRKALITGASAGIGEAFARHLARDGYDLVLVARRQERLDELSASLSSGHGVAVEVIAADLTKTRDVSTVEDRLRAGDVTLLVNNAGFGTFGEFVELPLKRELEELDLNVRALMRLTHAALEAMSPRGRGAVINVASTAAFQPIPYNATYAATKAFVLHFSEALHEEMRAHGVVVTCLCPGPVKTEFQEVGDVDLSRVPALAWTDVDRVVGAALSAVRHKRALVIPGALNLVGANSSRFVPRTLVRRLSGAMFKRVRV